jgi:hypothetical protein
MRLQTHFITGTTFIMVFDMLWADDMTPERAEQLARFGREAGAIATLVTTDTVQIPEGSYGYSEGQRTDPSPLLD